MGNDLHPLRKALVYPFRDFESLMKTVFIFCLAVACSSRNSERSKGYGHHFAHSRDLLLLDGILDRGNDSSVRL